MSPDEVIVTGYGWEDGGVFLRVRSLDQGDTDQWVLEDHVCFRVTEQRRCVGHSSAKGFVPCPHQAEPVMGSQCEDLK